MLLIKIFFHLPNHSSRRRRYFQFLILRFQFVFDFVGMFHFRLRNFLLFHRLSSHFFVPPINHGGKRSADPDRLNWALVGDQWPVTSRHTNARTFDHFVFMLIHHDRMTISIEKKRFMKETLLIEHFLLTCRNFSFHLHSGLCTLTYK